MRKVGLLISVGLGLAAAVGVADASIPPSYRVMVVSGDEQAAARSDALVQFMSRLGAFARVEPVVREQEARNCLRESDFGRCVRALVPTPENWRDPPHIIIRAEVGEAGLLGWHCVGSGAYRPPTDAQQIEVDAQGALFGDEPVKTLALRTAMDCIRSAALESSRL